MKKEKMYVRITITTLSVLIVLVAYLYVSGAFKERPNIRAYEKEEKIDTREPKDIYMEAKEDSEEAVAEENQEDKTDLEDKGEAEEEEETESAEDEKEDKNKREIIEYSLASEEDLEAIRLAREGMRNQNTKVEEKKDKKSKTEVKKEEGKQLKERIIKSDKPIEYNLPVLKDERTVDIVYHEYSYLNKKGDEVIKEEKENEVNEMAEYFEDKAYEEDLSYINEGERWYQGGQPRSSDVKIENGKKYVYVYGYEWLPWKKYKGTVTIESDLGKDPDRGIIIGEFH